VWGVFFGLGGGRGSNLTAGGTAMKSLNISSVRKMIEVLTTAATELPEIEVKLKAYRGETAHENQPQSRGQPAIRRGTSTHSKSWEKGKKASSFRGWRAASGSLETVQSA